MSTRVVANFARWCACGACAKILQRSLCEPCSVWCRSEFSSSKNVQYVNIFLKTLGLHVQVFTADTTACFEAGLIHGQWCLGDIDGRCVGALAWLVSEEHVCVLDGDVRRLSVPCVYTLGSAPWTLGHAGAPRRRQPSNPSFPHAQASDAKFVFDAAEAAPCTPPLNLSLIHI